MNRLLLCMMLMMASCLLWAQSTPPVTYTVKGVLLDSLTQESEPYATIRITKKEMPNKPVKLAVTDTNGKFQEQITGSGNYVIAISSIGKTTVVREFTLKPAEKTMDLGTLYTSDDTNELGTVEVIAQKPLVRVDVDKIEYNMEDDPDSQTNSVLEMLRKVPLVTVDGEENIQVNGSSSFKVHVNGKPNNMMSNNPKEVLRSMPANSIKYIEVITSPGAKYDAEGVGGILNIVTMGGGFEGYTVTLSGRVNNTGVGGSAYGTVQKGKLTVTGNYGYNYNDRPRMYSSNVREYLDNGDKEISDGGGESTGSFQHGNLEASYEIDTLRLVTMAFGMYGGGGDNTSDNTTGIANKYSYSRIGDSENSWYSIRGNIDYQRLFSLKGRMLTFSYRINTQPESSDGYTKYINKDISEEWEGKFNLEDRRSDVETNTTEHTFQADYVTPIGKIHTIETGVKYIVRDNHSDSKNYVTSSGKEILDEERTVDYKHMNDILAAYAGYTLRYKTLSGKAGVRYEHTMLDVKYKTGLGENFDKEYDDFVPSASIGMRIGQTKNIRGGYDMRIWRPSIYYLNPYRDISNPTSISYGNPNLETEKSHSFNISFSSFTSKFNVNLALRHSFNNNSIERYSFVQDGIMHNTFDNIGKTRNTSMSAYVNWNASPLTRIYMNANGGYNDYRSPKQNLKNSGWNVFLYGGIQHTLPHEIRVTLNAMGSTPSATLQGTQGGFFDYNLSVNKSFLNKRLTLSAFAGNIFHKYTTHESKSSGVNFHNTSKSKYSRQRFGINISYRIGELKAQVKKAARSINNDDVKGGGGEGGGEGGN
ncbi:TonB-dependent receptor [Bacteroides sp. OttesenSCG-928-J23]|nr:TonB-dependent receptor [Bacteroides sp. OttesenSCG-928-J23]MDL2303845.1 TonB-dependent receptor [Bacteroides sp. OttesenSCG-928-D19]